MTDFSFSQVTLVLPRPWEEPWERYLAEAAGNERLVIEAQAIFGKMLQRVEGARPSAELLAWLAIWSRFASCLTALRGALDWPSQVGGWAVARASLESFLHLEGIQRQSGAPGAEAERDWELVRERLRGYLAWSLWEERRECEELLKEDRLDAVFDPKPARELIARLGDAREALEALTGWETPVVSEQEAEFDRSRAVRSISERVSELDRWLNEPTLRGWGARLRHADGRTRGAVSLFELLGEKRSVFAVLTDRDCAHLYPLYLRASAAIHGSGLRTALIVKQDVVALSIVLDAQHTDAYVDIVLANTRTAAITLEMLLERLLGGPLTA